MARDYTKIKAWQLADQRVNFLYRKVWGLKSEIQCLNCRRIRVSEVDKLTKFNLKGISIKEANAMMIGVPKEIKDAKLHKKQGFGLSSTFQNTPQEGAGFIFRVINEEETDHCD